MKRKGVPGDNKQSLSNRPTKHSKNDANVPATLQVQIIVGTYDKVLHGITAALPEPELSPGDDIAEDFIVFKDNFKFNAHRSAIRCLATSPLQSQDASSEARRIFLASGGTDGCINIYQIDPTYHSVSAAAVNGTQANGHNAVSTSRKNEAIGSLFHHSSYINSLKFSSRTKLFSAADDSTIAVSRTRDWAVLTTLKAPIPEAKGRPSGDTAPPGTAPSGVNDFSIHPSKKLMISVSKGDNSMRLWNLVTGKKAGKLDFEPSLMQAAGARRGSKGEGSRAEWNYSGDEFVICFERGVAAFSMDCKPKGVFRAQPDSKIHRVRYLPAIAGSTSFLLAGTEDGRLVLTSTTNAAEEAESRAGLPMLKTLGEISGKDQGNSGRVKDFEIVRCITKEHTTTLLVVTVSSNGSIHVWKMSLDTPPNDTSAAAHSPPRLSHVTGFILGTYMTDSRITCLSAFLMHARSSQGDTEITTSNGPVLNIDEKLVADSQKDHSDEEFEGLASDTS